MTVAILLEKALRLSQKERADLALQLLQSLHNGQGPDAEQAWEEELRQRLEDLKTGRVQGLNLQQALRIIMDNSDDAS